MLERNRNLSRFGQLGQKKPIGTLLINQMIQWICLYQRLIKLILDGKQIPASFRSTTQSTTVAKPVLPRQAQAPIKQLKSTKLYSKKVWLLHKSGQRNTTPLRKFQIQKFQPLTISEVSMITISQQHLETRDTAAPVTLLDSCRH